MAKNQRPQRMPVFEQPADEVVSDILSDAARRQEEMRLSPEERKLLIESRRKDAERKEKAHKKSQRQKAENSHLLLPGELRNRLAAIARWHHITISQVVAYFLFDAVKLYEKGEIKFDGHKFTSKSPRYEFKLIHPDDPEWANVEERNSGENPKWQK